MTSWRLWFFVSAALNILVLGAAIGFVAGGGGRDEAVDVAASQSPRQLMAALPPGARTEVRRGLVRAWVAAREQRAALRAAQTEVANRMRAEPYDAEAVREALARQRAASDALVATFHDELAGRLGELSPEQRRAAADALVNWRQARAAVEYGAPGALGEQPEAAPGEPLRAVPADREELRERLRERVKERLRERREQAP